MRSRSASKSSAPSRAMTTSPSSTQRSGSAARSGAASSGKYRSSGLRSRDCVYTSSPSRKTRARKPSHLGSNSQPSSLGSESAALASIGSIGGSNGSAMAQRYRRGRGRADRRPGADRGTCHAPSASRGCRHGQTGRWRATEVHHMRTIRTFLPLIAIAVVAGRLLGLAARRLSTVGAPVGGPARARRRRPRAARPAASHRPTSLPSRRRVPAQAASSPPSTTPRSSGRAPCPSRSATSRRPCGRPATGSSVSAATSVPRRPATRPTSRRPRSPIASRPTNGRRRSTCCTVSAA